MKKGWYLGLCALSCALSTSAGAGPVPKCGTSAAEKALQKNPALHWTEVLKVEFTVPALRSGEPTEVKGRLCASWEWGSRYTIHGFSFAADSGFDEVFDIAELTERARSVFSNAHLAKISSVASYAVRAGELLTLNLVALAHDQAAEETEYTLQLRFPKTLARQLFGRQSSEFYSVPIQVVRRKAKLEAIVGEIDPSARIGIEIDLKAFTIGTIAIEGEREHKFLPKDFDLVDGPFLTPNRETLRKQVKELAALEGERKQARSQSSPVFSLQGERFIP